MVSGVPSTLPPLPALRPLLAALVVTTGSLEELPAEPAGRYRGDCQLPSVEVVRVRAAGWGGGDGGGEEMRR